MSEIVTCVRYSPLCLDSARTNTIATTISSRKMNASTAECKTIC